MSFRHHSVEITRTQFAVPLARIDPICPSDSECHLLRSLSTAVLGAEMNVGTRVTLDRVLLLVLCYTATRLLLLQNTSDPWHSVQLSVLCIYLLEWFQSRRFAAGSISGNTTELHPQWRVQSLFWPSAHFWGNANLYLSTALCIRLNSSKLHSSNNNVSHLHSSIYTATLSPASGTARLSASSASHSIPSQLWVFHMLHTQHVCAPPTTLDPSGSRDPTQRSHGSY